MTKENGALIQVLLVPEGGELIKILNPVRLDVKTVIWSGGEAKRRIMIDGRICKNAVDALNKQAGGPISVTLPRETPFDGTITYYDFRFNGIDYDALLAIRAK